MDGTITVKKLADNIWTFNEAVESEPGSPTPTRPQVDAYLICGRERALVIDALFEERSLYAKVRELTSLPLDLLLSHGHHDHAGVSVRDFYAADCDVYLSEEDHSFLARLNLDPSIFKPLNEGMIFDIGGYKLETIGLKGHTPGSMVFLEAEKQHLYTGDAIGAGVFWMQNPGSAPLKVFRKNLGRLWDRVKDMDGLIIHTGHRHQAPIQHDLQFMEDVIFVTDKIISGEMPGEARESNRPNFGPVKYRTVAYKHIRDYCYNPDNIG